MHFHPGGIPVDELLLAAFLAAHTPMSAWVLWTRELFTAVRGRFR